MINYFREEYNWLSNFSNFAPIPYKGHVFQSVECAYMWAKNPDDKHWLEFCLTKAAGECKKASRAIQLPDDWDDRKLSVMKELLQIKFSKKPYKERLLATGNENIIEGNYWNDKFWGMCLKSNPNVGENHLGRLIMEVREELKQNKS